MTPALLRASAPRDGRLCSLPVVSPSHVTRLLLLRTRLNSVTCHAWGHSHHELPVALPPGKDRACFLWGRNPNGARARPGWFDSSFLLRAGVPLLHLLPPLETIPPVPPSALLSFFPHTALPRNWFESQVMVSAVLSARKPGVAWNEGLGGWREFPS